MREKKDICWNQVSQKRLKGINFYYGELKDFVSQYLYNEGRKISFDIMNLDFCGNFLTYVEGVSQLMPSFLSGSGLTMAVTTLHQHDRNLPYRGQLALNLLRAALNGKPLFWKVMHNLENEESCINRLSKSSTNEKYNLYREAIFLWWLMEQIIIHQINQVECVELNQNLKIQLAQSVAEIERKFSIVYSKNTLDFVQDFSLYQLIKDIKSWFWPIELMRFNYVATRTSRFSVWFVKLEKSNGFENCRDVTEIIEETLVNISSTPLYLYESGGNKITIEC